MQNCKWEKPKQLIKLAVTGTKCRLCLYTRKVESTSREATVDPIAIAARRVGVKNTDWF